MSHNAPLWFLPALFSTELIYTLISKIIKKIRGRLIISSLLAIIGLFLYGKNINYLPWGISIALIAVLFFCIGDCLKCIHIKLTRPLSLFVSIALMFALVLAQTLIGPIRFDMASGNVGSFSLFPIFLLFALFGSLSILTLSKVIEKCSCLEYLGRSEICITVMAIHGIVNRIIRYVISWLSIDINLYVNVFLVVALTILICLPLGWLYQQYIAPLFRNKQ